MSKGEVQNGEKLSKKEKEKQRKALKNKQKKQKNKENKKLKKSQNNDGVSEAKEELLKKLKEMEAQQEDSQIQEENQQNNQEEINDNQEQQQEEMGEEDEDEQQNQQVKDIQILTGKYYDEFKEVFENHDALGDRMLSKQLENDDRIIEQKQAEEEENKEIAEKKKDKQNKQDLGQETLSRKQLKAKRWLKVAALKALVKRPDLVEAWDITAPDPLLLVQMKSLRNTVAVPPHWNQKRKYLQNKRGIIKPPFKLPEHIEATGIAKLRDPFTERDGVAMVKQKLKDRMNPKLGKIDIEYEVLHDAFFKYVTKPKLTIHGDMYHEGKEEDIKSTQYKPGKLSEELRNALGISDFTPPPWLINMQRYGPPPAYPNLKVIGLHNDNSMNFGFVSRQQNIEEASKGIQQSGVYANFKVDDEDDDDQKVDKGYWGGLVEDDEEDEEDDDDLDPEDDSDNLQPDFQYQMEQHQKQMNEQQQKQQDQQAMIDGLETPEVDLRQPQVRGERNDQFQYSSGGAPPPPSDLPLFQVLEPTQTKGNSQGQIFGGGSSYIIPDQKVQK